MFGPVKTPSSFTIILNLVTLKSGGPLLLLLLLLLSAVTHAPFHAQVLRPTSWPNARDRRDGEVN